VADGDRFGHGYDHDHGHDHDHVNVNGAIGGTSPLSFMRYRTLILSDISVLRRLRPDTRNWVHAEHDRALRGEWPARGKSELGCKPQ
jgi:hypothetical protein